VRANLRLQLATVPEQRIETGLRVVEEALADEVGRNESRCAVIVAYGLDDVRHRVRERVGSLERGKAWVVLELRLQLTAFVEHLVKHLVIQSGILERVVLALKLVVDLRDVRQPTVAAVRVDRDTRDPVALVTPEVRDAFHVADAEDLVLDQPSAGLTRADVRRCPDHVVALLAADGQASGGVRSHHLRASDRAPVDFGLAGRLVEPRGDLERVHDRLEAVEQRVLDPVRVLRERGIKLVERVRVEPLDRGGGRRTRPERARGLNGVQAPEQLQE
jgi:hypothetical protein